MKGLIQQRKKQSLWTSVHKYICTSYCSEVEGVGTLATDELDDRDLALPICLLLVVLRICKADCSGTGDVSLGSKLTTFPCGPATATL